MILLLGRTTTTNATTAMANVRRDEEDACLAIFINIILFVRLYESLSGQQL